MKFLDFIKKIPRKAKAALYILRKSDIIESLARQEIDRVYNPKPLAVYVKTPQSPPQTHAQIWERIKPTFAELMKMRWAIPNLKEHYLFTAIIIGEPDAGLADTVSSIDKQIYDKYNILIEKNVDNLYKAVAVATGDYVLILKAGDLLHKNALFELTVELNLINDTPPLLYFDHDYFVGGIIDRPCYKPDWSLDLLLVNNYINRACVYKRDLLLKVNIKGKPFDVAQHDIVLKLAEFGTGHHMPGILLTMPYDEHTCDIQENSSYLTSSVARCRYIERDSPIVYRLCGPTTVMCEGVKKVIIVKLDFVGDFVVSLPTIRKIRQILPNAQIDVLCGSWSKEIFELLPEIDNIRIYDFYDNNSGHPRGDIDELTYNVINEIKKERYDLAINLRRHPETKHITPLLADYAIVFSEELATDAASHPMPAVKPVPSSNPRWNIADQFLFLANALEYDESLYKEIITPAEIRKKIDIYFCDTPLGHTREKLLIGIHAGAREWNEGRAKAWPIDNFAALCDLITTKLNADVIIFGGENDIEFNDKILALVKNKNMVMSAAGAFTLAEFYYAVKKVDYFIANNSGPAHVAGLQGVSTLVIWHGESAPEEWSSIGKAVMQVECSMICKPCYGTCKTRDCITNIQPEEVFYGLRRLMILFPSNATYERISV